MLARRDLGYHAAIALVQPDLRGDDTGANPRHARARAAADLPEPPRPSRRTSSRWPEESSCRDRVTLQFRLVQAALLASASFARRISSALSSCLSTNGAAGSWRRFRRCRGLVLVVARRFLVFGLSFDFLLRLCRRSAGLVFSASKTGGGRSCGAPWRRTPGRDRAGRGTSG